MKRAAAATLFVGDQSRIETRAPDEEVPHGQRRSRSVSAIERFVGVGNALRPMLVDSKERVYFPRQGPQRADLHHATGIRLEVHICRERARRVEGSTGQPERNPTGHDTGTPPTSVPQK